jgi:hypothetical protein
MGEVVTNLGTGADRWQPPDLGSLQSPYVARRLLHAITTTLDARREPGHSGQRLGPRYAGPEGRLMEIFTIAPGVAWHAGEIGMRGAVDLRALDVGTYSEEFRVIEKPDAGPDRFALKRHVKYVRSRSAVPGRKGIYPLVADFSGLGDDPMREYLEQMAKDIEYGQDAEEADMFALGYEQMHGCDRVSDETATDLIRHVAKATLFDPPQDVPNQQ